MIDGDLLTVWLDCVAVGDVLANEVVVELTVDEMMEHFGGSLKLRARSSDETWLTFQDILDGYFDRLRGVSSGNSLRDTVETVSIRKGAGDERGG